MYSFGPRSRRNLKTCHGDLEIIAEKAIELIDFSVIVGHRGQSEQDEAFNKGLSKVKWPDSKHNTYPSMAFDVAPYPIIWDKTDTVSRVKAIGRFYLLAGILVGTANMLHQDGDIQHRLRWGGDWDMDGDILDQTFEDLGHFELVS